ncbi:MAG: flagellar protein export ATPase FliI [Oscillospiraceae bacterium]|jgi:flagellum-specific ATP synthase|nr:flagellar protein export ATPase FliI [Oscillospiraceae bacterium]
MKETAVTFDFEKLTTLLYSMDSLNYSGKVHMITGLTVESAGPSVKIGEMCRIYTLRGDKSIQAEVVGFKDKRILLMPYGDLAGVGPGSRVVSTNRTLRVPVGMDFRGRVLDGLGAPIDGGPPVCASEYYPVENAPPNPLSRPRIHEILPLGVRAVDGLLTCGRGQRIGIFAGSGVGKSTLLGMIARNARSDVNVITLIGERGREVNDFLQKDLKAEGLARSVIVVASSDQPALVRSKSAMVGTSIAEYYRDRGLNVLLMMDSLTRYAMAQREIGMAVGEPPVSRGYTPSVYTVMPKLLERAGNSEKGSITALYTVLVEGDDLNEPITDTARGILDGHIVLSRDLANRNHYPAIDVLASVSRLMPDIVTTEHRQAAGRMKRLMAVYKDAEDLINIGAYKAGSNAEIDEAFRLHGAIEAILCQEVDESCAFEDTVARLAALEEKNG